MGHKTGSMDDRYTIIDDEDLDAAAEKMNAYQKERGMHSEYEALQARLDTLTDREFQRFVELRFVSAAARAAAEGRAAG